MDPRDARLRTEPRPAHDARPARHRPPASTTGASDDASAIVLCDAAGLGPPDIGTVAALARLALGLRRLGCRLEIRHASPELRDLLVLAGLDGALPCSDESAVEAER